MPPDKKKKKEERELKEVQSNNLNSTIKHQSTPNSSQNAITSDTLKHREVQHKFLISQEVESIQKRITNTRSPLAIKLAPTSLFRDGFPTTS